MPEVQKGQEQPVFLTFILYRYNLSFYYNQVQFVPVFIIEKRDLVIEVSSRVLFVLISVSDQAIPGVTSGKLSLPLRRKMALPRNKSILFPLNNDFLYVK